MGIFNYIRKGDKTASLIPDDNGSVAGGNGSSETTPAPAPERDSGDQIVQAAMHTDNTRSANAIPVSSQDQKADVFSRLLEKSYREDEDSLRRQQMADFWGNLAALFGQTAAIGMGARNISPITPKTQEYNSAIDRIRQSYNKDMANYSLYQAKSDAAARQAELDRKAKTAEIELKAKIEAGIIDRNHGYAMIQQMQKAKDAEELAKLKAKADKITSDADRASRERIASANRSSRERIASANNSAAMEREKYRQEKITGRSGAGKGSKVSREPIKVKWQYGDGTTYDMSKDKDVAKMYNYGVSRGFIKKIGDFDVPIDDMRTAIYNKLKDVKKDDRITDYEPQEEIEEYIPSRK